MYYQRLLINSLPKNSRIKRSLNLLRLDRYMRKWDKNQFYSNFINSKNFNKPNFRSKNFNNYSYNKKNISNFKFSDKFTSSKKPIYRQRFQKKFSK